ncbi:MAG: ribonuclease T [Pseudomonadota bacterium]|nr:ribonuclease T [Pseudomonadota bacterium]
MDLEQKALGLAGRFRGFLPVVVDVETGGFNAGTDALLEIAAVLIRMDEAGRITPKETLSFHVAPFAGANIESAALAVNGIKPDHPLRPALPEREALRRIFTEVRRELRELGCQRAILVGHNAHFDLGFLNAAVERTQIKRNPFHPFTCFDTATLAGVAFGQTVLARAASVAGLDFDSGSAHSAGYDALRTAELFCQIVNGFQNNYEKNLLAANHRDG